MDSQGIGYTFQFLRDIDNDNDYDYNFDQQLRITQISVINSTDQWDASIGDAQYYLGKKPENFLSQHDIIPGTRYSNPDKIVHEIWMKAIGMPLYQHFDASAIEGTIDVWLNCTLTTYQDRSELKVGVTINLEGSGLPMNYDTPYTLRMLFTNSLGQREYVGATNGFGLEADEVSNYTATYHLPTNETISSYRLDRNYTETRDGIEYQKQANPYLDGPQGSGKHYGGNYDFTDLIWGRTTQVSLDPTMINYGSYGAGTSAIDGFQVIPLIILSFLGVTILMLNLRRKIR
jgi:hypothetical protein